MRTSLVAAFLVFWVNCVLHSQDAPIKQSDRVWGQALLLPDDEEFARRRLSLLVQAAELSGDDPTAVMSILHTAAEDALFSDGLHDGEIEDIIGSIGGDERRYQILMQEDGTLGGILRISSRLLRESEKPWRRVLRVVACEDIDNFFFLLPGCRADHRDESLQAFLLHGKQGDSVLEAVSPVTRSSENGVTGILLASKYASEGKVSVSMEWMEYACRRPLFTVHEYTRCPGDTDIIVPPSRRAEKVGLVGVVASSGVFDSLDRTTRGLRRQERFVLNLEENVLDAESVAIEVRARLAHLMLLAWLRLHVDEQASCRQYFVGWDLREAAVRFLNVNGGMPQPLAECRKKMRELTESHSDLNRLLVTGGAEVVRVGGDANKIEKLYRREIVQGAGLTSQVVRDYAKSVRVIVEEDSM